MKRHSFAASLALAVVAVLGLAGPAAAGEQVPFKGDLEGSYTRTGMFPFFHIEPTVEGQATHLGKFTCFMPHDVNLLATSPEERESSSSQRPTATRCTVPLTRTQLRRMCRASSSLWNR